MSPLTGTRAVRTASWSFLVIGVLACAASLEAQVQSGIRDTLPASTLADIDAGRRAVEENAELSEQIKAEALDFYDRAATARQQAEQTQADTAALIERIDNAPERLAALRAQIESAQAPREVESPPSDAPIEELQALLTSKRAELTSASDALEGKEAELNALTQSGEALVEAFVARDRKIAELAQEARVAAPAGMPPALATARRTYLAAQLALERTALAQMQRRNASYDLLVELATLERDLAAAETSRLRNETAALAAALRDRREARARADRLEAEIASAEASDLPPPIAAIAKENAALKEESISVIEKEEVVNEALRATAVRYREIQSDFETMRERIATYGASRAIGRLMQRRLHELPTAREQRGYASERRAEIADITDRRIQIEVLQERLPATRDEVDAILAKIDLPEHPAEVKRLRTRTTEIIQAQHGTLKNLDLTYGRYLTRLTALDAADREVARVSREFRVYLRNQLTWIPNLSPLSLRDLEALPAALAWLLSPTRWSEALSDAMRTVVENAFLTILALLALTAAVIGRRRARRRLPELAGLTRRIRTDSYVHTVKALGLTLVAASVWPLVVGIAGWQVEAEPIGGAFGNSIGGALMDVVPFLFVLILLFWLTRSDGVGPAHFRWPAVINDALHRRIGWLAVVLVPAAVLIFISHHAQLVEMSYALGRPMLLVVQVALVAFVWRFFRRSGPFMQHFDEERPDGWISRLWFLWFPLLLAVPVGLFVGTALGYAYTAQELTGLLLGRTASLLLGIFIVKDMLLRWFYVVERRSRFEAAVEQRGAARGHHDEDTSGRIEVDVPEIDFRELGEQARSVTRVGVFLGIILSIGWIWADLLPAIGFLDRVELPFSKVTIEDGVERQLPVTLADLAIGILVLAGTFFVARNLSGVLGFTLLRRLRFDAGGNYAIVTLCQYLIVAIGIVAAFSTIGLQWSKLQWLIAALGVGLGFGLQEIVANFVSGIILLLERPVRIGDIVTVGGADGYVSRIRIRATTILTWEKKELIIPNKEFITGQVVNWTLSDSVNRILVSVGIAYGSDVRKALELLGDVARENEFVLDDPAPVITFEAFGDNALMLYARCYVSSLDHRLETITALHQAIYDKFEDGGIVIAFPQRDVHLDTSKPLEIRLHPQDLRPADGTAS